MNPITRLILRHVVSGKVKLTPRLLKVLRELDRDQIPGRRPEHLGRSPKDSPDLVSRRDSASEKHLTFVSPLPGRWIRRTGCGVGVALLLAANLAGAASTSDTFAAANNAFARGKYAEAARGYESILQQRGFSAPVLFNLANSQQENHQPGQAILNYSRTALLSPNDPDIAANLNQARNQAGLEQIRPTLVQRIAHGLTMNTWFGLAATALFLLSITLPLIQLRPKARRVISIGGVLAALGLVSALGALGLRTMDLQNAVVVGPEVIATDSPVTVAQPAFQLREGETVTIQQRHGDFVQIQNREGNKGTS